MTKSKPMMKCIKLALGFFLILNFFPSFIAHAQEQAKYVKYDQLSKAVNDLQLAANDLKFTDGQKTYTVSFPGQNFKFNYHDRLASTAVYFVDSASETVEITEKIDFSKAIAIETKKSAAPYAGIVKVIFPTDFLTTNVYKGSKVVTKKTNNINFYVAGNTGRSTMSTLWSKQNAAMYNALIDVIFFSKREANAITAATELSQRNAWVAALTSFTLSAVALFNRDFSNSIYHQQAVNLESVLLEQQKILGTYNDKMDSVALFFKFKWGLDDDAFKKLNPEAADAIKRMKYNNGSYEKRYSGIGQPFTEGPNSYTPVGSLKNKGVLYSVVALRSKNGAEATTNLFETWKSYFRSNFSGSMILEKDGHFFVTSPNSIRKLMIFRVSVLKVDALFFNFIEKE